MPAAPASHVVGRAAEVQAVEGFVTAPADGPATLLLSGQGGAGKTVLWNLGVNRARTLGHTVLVARAAEAEAHFGFAGLGDLLAGRLDDTARDLPGPQRHALRVALALDDPGRDFRPEAIRAGLLGVLRSLAGGGQVLVAVDDAQWLDQASAEVLGFAGRRLQDAPVRFLVTRRSGTTAGWLPSLPRPRTDVLVGPMDRAPLQRLLHERLGGGIPSRMLRRLWQISEGNPFFALELGRLIASRNAAPDQGDPFEIPTDLDLLLRGRLSVLPHEARTTLLAVALLAEPTLDQVEAAAGGRRDALLPAFAAQLAELDGARVRFTHPLFASAVAAGADEHARRETHRRLAGLVTDPEQRARHLALGMLPPDEATAVILDRAAGHAIARGAVHSAADLAEQAWRFATAGPARWSRLLTATDYQLRVGALAEATTRLERELPAIAPGPLRAQLLLRLIRSLPEAGRKEELLDEALAQAGDDAGLRAEILSEWVYFVAADVDRVEDADRAMREAVLLAERSGNRELEVRCRANLAWSQAALGRDVEAVLSGVKAAPPDSLWDHSDRIRAVQLIWRGELNKASALLVPLRDRAASLEEEWSELVYALHLFELEARRGDAVAAARRLAELRLAVSGIGEAEPILARCTAQLAALRGDVAAARVAAARALDDPDASRWHRLEATRALAVAELTAGHPEHAVGSLDAIAKAVTAGGFRDPGAFPVAGDLAEALHWLHRGAEAERVLGSLAAMAAEQSHPWGLATSARIRGLLSDDPDLLTEASERYAALSLRLESGRARLELGRLLRRSRRRSEARRVLGEAVALFGELGLPAWADRAEAEAAKIGGRPGTGVVLTPAEDQVAKLVAEGLTNKEAAARLFVSVSTVEAALTRVYAKLGVRSRAELARRFT